MFGKYIKSSLDKVKAEDELISSTEKYLRENIKKGDLSKTNYIRKRSVGVMKRLSVAACLVLLVCGLSIGGYAYYKTPVAYLSIDINPSVELGINAFNVVVSAESYNDDGTAILEGQNVINSNVENAVSTLVQSATDKGYIADDGSTIVSVTSESDDDDADDNAITDAAERGINKAMERKECSAVIYKAKVVLERREEARELGITPGKLNLIQKLQALDPEVSVEDYKDAPVKEIMKSIIEHRKNARLGNDETADTTAGDETTAPSDTTGTQTGNVCDTTGLKERIRENRLTDADFDKIEKALERAAKNQENKENKGNKENAKGDNSQNCDETSCPADTTAAVDESDDSGDADAVASPTPKRNDDDENTKSAPDTNKANGKDNGKYQNNGKDKTCEETTGVPSDVTATSIIKNINQKLNKLTNKK